MRMAMILAIMGLGLFGCRPIIIQSSPPHEPAQPAETAAEPAAESAPAEPEPASAVTAGALSEQPEPAAPESAKPAKPAKSNPATGSAKKDNGKKPKEKPAHEQVRPEHEEPKPKQAESTQPEPNAPAPKNAGASTPAAEPAVSTPTEPSDHLTTVRSIEVRVEGTGTGVAARIWLDPPGQPHPFAETDGSGVVQPNASCKLSDRFAVDPVFPNYVLVDPERCGATITFKMSTMDTLAKLAQLGDEALKQGNPGLAHVYYAAAAKRLRKGSPQEAAQLLEKANEAAAQALKVPGKRKTRKREMTEALRDYQSKSKLPVTGELDEKTKQALAGIDDAEAMKRAVAAPEAKPKTLKPKTEAQPPQLFDQRLEIKPRGAGFERKERPAADPIQAPRKNEIIR